MAKRTAEKLQLTTAEKFNHVWCRLDSLQETDGAMWLEIDALDARLSKLALRGDTPWRRLKALVRWVWAGD